MIGKILNGTIEVISEIISGLKEVIADCSFEDNGISETLEVINIKMMGSYEDMERLARQKNSFEEA